MKTHLSSQLALEIQQTQCSEFNLSLDFEIFCHGCWEGTQLINAVGNTSCQPEKLQFLVQRQLHYSTLLTLCFTILNDKEAAELALEKWTSCRD